MAAISIYLHGKPEWELTEKITGDVLREYGKVLQERMIAIAKDLDVLRNAGWSEPEMALYDFYLRNDAIKSKDAVEEHLKSLGIDPETVHIEEDEEEFEEDEE